MQDTVRRIENLEKRLSRLEKSEKTACYNFYMATKERTVASRKHEMSFTFVSKCEQCLFFTLEIETQSPKYNAVIEVDGAKAVAAQCEKNGKIEFIAPLNAGEKTISVKLSSTSSFFVRRATLKTYGAVGYPDGECFVTVINEGLKSHVCYCYDNELLVKEYVETLLTMIQIQGAKCGTICKVGDLLAVFYIDLSGMLWGRYYTSDEYDLVRSCLIDQGVSAVCALSGGNEATLFSVKGGRVYRYTADKNFNLTTQITEYGARRVSCDPSLSGYIIITDFSGNGKIIKI